MELLATLSIIVSGISSALASYLFAHRPLRLGASSGELRSSEKVQNIAQIVTVVAMVGFVVLLSNGVAQPPAFAMVVAAIGVANGVVGALVGVVRHSHRPGPHGRCQPA